MVRSIEVKGFSEWASYLVNGDDSGITETDYTECMEWLLENGVLFSRCLSGEHDGPEWVEVGGKSVFGECMVYTFAVTCK